MSSLEDSIAIPIIRILVKSTDIRIRQTNRMENTGAGSSKIRAIGAKPKLKSRLKKVTKANMPDEVDITWGAPAGLRNGKQFIFFSDAK